MKRIIIAISFIVIAIFLSCLGYYTVMKQADKTIDYLNAIVESLDQNDDQKTIDAANEAVEFWEKADVKLEIFLDHEMTEEIEINFKSIQRYAEGDHDVMLSEVCNECINYLEHMKEASTPTWATLL